MVIRENKVCNSSHHLQRWENSCMITLNNKMLGKACFANTMVLESL